MSAAADIALVLVDGVIRDVAIGNSVLCEEGYADHWRGKPWIETVTVESRAKIEDLLSVGPNSKPHWRHVNHPTASGIDLPVRYTTVPSGKPGHLIAIGRDLRSIAELQQRLIEAHQGLERDYDRMRAVETQYRMLFQMVSDAVIILDPDEDRIEQANRAAATLLESDPAGLTGRHLLDLFAKRYTRQIEKTIASALATGTAMSDTVRSISGRVWRLSMSPFRVGDDVRLIVRILDDDANVDTNDDEKLAFLRVTESIPDGLVVTRDDMIVSTANRAFALMAGYSGGEFPTGRNLADFVGRSITDLNVLVSNLKRHGSVRNFSTIMRDRFGLEEPVEVSAVTAPSRDGDVFGFSIRNVARRLEAGPRIGEALPSSVEQITGLVGKVPLKDIIRESTNLIEKLCIEAALEITNDNRASAADILGLSRQGLYSKLKRFGMDD